MTDWRHDNYFGPNEFTNIITHDMSNKEAFDIVLKLAKANTLAEHDIMYAQQEAQASLERQAIEIVEDYRQDLIFEENGWR